MTRLKPESKVAIKQNRFHKNHRILRALSARNRFLKGYDKMIGILFPVLLDLHKHTFFTLKYFLKSKSVEPRIYIIIFYIVVL